MIKIEGYLNKKSIQALFIKYLFKGNKKQFEVWWNQEPFKLTLKDKHLFNLLCESLFDGDYDKCEDFWYNYKIEGLDNMYPSDLCNSSDGRKLLLAWAEGYLTGLDSKEVDSV